MKWDFGLSEVEDLYAAMLIAGINKTEICDRPLRGACSQGLAQLNNPGSRDRFRVRLNLICSAQRNMAGGDVKLFTN